MSFAIKKAAVIGAGVMGSGIAAHLANAGVPVILLDIVPFNAADGEDTSSKAFRNKLALNAVKGFKKQRPAPLFTPRAAALIEVGNLEDDLDKLADVDWVVEAVIERADIKQKVFSTVEANVHEHCIVTSNTSGLSIESMLEGRSDNFRKHFMVTHFFNPVRYMKLLELVAGVDTAPEVIAAMHKFGEETLGKGIVYGKDTTNFIANRIGVYGIMKTLEVMREMNLTVEAVDTIFGPAMGRPKSAIFRTADLVGLDTLVHVAKNCYDTLPNDEERDVFAIPEYVTKMVEGGMLGNKTRGGFYKKGKDASGKRVIEVLDLDTLTYRAKEKVRYPSIGNARNIDDLNAKIAMVMGADDDAGRFAEKVTLAVLAYASNRIPEIADDIVNIDRGMRWGFAWEQGPFETWDAYGVEKGLARMKELGYKPAKWVEDMVASGRTSFYGVDGTKDTYWDIPTKAAADEPLNPRTLKVEYLKRGDKKIKQNFGATLWDMGDDVALLEFHTKMNSLNDDVIKMMHNAVDIVEKDFKGLVIGNNGGNFSAGADIMALLMAAKAGQYDGVEKMVASLQHANQRMRYSSFPVVTAPYQLTLGGGCEVTMGGNFVQAAAETYIGLVEFGVGLIPGGGGNLQLLRNVYGPFAEDKDFDAFPFLKKVFLKIGLAHVATSGEEAAEVGFLGPNYGISLNGDFQLNDAKNVVIGLADGGFRPPRETKFRLPGKSGMATFDMSLYDMKLNGMISEHDRKIGAKLANVLCGGDTSPLSLVTEQYLLDLEREAFLSLLGEPLTQDRLEHMLMKNKPLRN